MQKLEILRAMLVCPYKAWLLTKEKSNDLSQEESSDHRFTIIGTKACLVIPAAKITPNDKLAAAAWCILKSASPQGVMPVENVKIEYGSTVPGSPSPRMTVSIKVKQYAKKSHKLVADLKQTLSKDEPPIFYKNPHCPECQFRDSCHKKLIERDCISLLPGMSAKVLSKYHSKGLFSITQISHNFRPRRRGRRPHTAHGAYLWDLKALAIREKKTFVIYPPDIEQNLKEIFIDFEGLPDENWIYLIGIVIREPGHNDEYYSYWADTKDKESDIFQKLFTLLIKHPDASIYHYGSYETQAFKQITKKYEGVFKQELPEIERRMVNILSFLRTHVYSPTYGNGLKEVAAYLGFQWQNQEADGMLSIKWRKTWETTRDIDLKEKLVQYNIDDCLALAKVCHWLMQLTLNPEKDKVQRVSDMKKQSPYKFQNNKEFGEDFNVINRASYFDYQHSKIYWRNQRSRIKTSSQKTNEARHLGRGKHGWAPQKVNEVVVMPQLKSCPKCGHKKVYPILSQEWKWRQTDLKFTSSGIKQWVVEYRTTQIKCANCYARHNNGVVRRMLFGDNLFAWATNLYVTYHISHEMISRLLEEQFGIWAFRQYFIDRQHKWWSKWQQEVDYLWKTIRQSPVIHIDETTVKLSKDRGYVWAFATPDTVFYHFTLTRETDFLQDWLKDYTGVIITDSFAGYETLKLKQQKCLIHLIRDLNDDLFKNPFDEEYKSIVVGFGKVLRKIIETVDKHGLKRYYLQKHIKDTDRFYKHFVERENKSGLSIKCVKRLKKHWTELWTFLHHDGVPWNNNNAEAAAKAFAQHRRGVNGQVSEKGVRDYLKMLSLAQTCRYRGIPFLDLLRYKAGLWQGIPASMLPNILPFSQARLYIHKLKFKNKKEWVAWLQTNKRPSFIPDDPERIYAGMGWVSWQDWLTGD